MSHKVTEIIDGDTFAVSPDWEWNGESGNIVRPVGYNTPEKDDSGYEYAKRNLKLLICGEEVELTNPVGISYGRLLCTVIFKGKNLADYFTKYE